jgi:hypothetical protein
MMTSLSEGYASLILLVVLLFVAIHVGHRLGTKVRRARGDVTKGTNTIDTFILGLLALILAFVFLTSETRFERRVDVATAQVNAIATAYDQSKALPEPARSEIQGLLRQYAVAQRGVFKTHEDRWYESPAYVQAVDLQWRIWNRYVQLCGSLSVDYCTMLLPGITRLHEVSLHQLVQRQTHSTRGVFLLVIVLSTCGAGLCGFSLAAHGPKRMRAHKAAYVIGLIATFWVIFDLEYLRHGTIQMFEPLRPAYDKLYERMGL